jgi:hypothetical protein
MKLKIFINDFGKFLEITELDMSISFFFSVACVLGGSV